MSVDVKKVNSDQNSSKSPNQRKEAFKQKRKVNETNEGKNLRNRAGAISSPDRQNTEPIYENIGERQRPVPQKPKRHKNMQPQPQSANKLSAIDPSRFPDKSPNQRREDFKQKRKVNETNEGKNLRNRAGAISSPDRQNTEPIYENIGERQRPVPQKPKRHKNMQPQSQSANKLSYFDVKAEQLKQQILSDYEKNKTKKTKSTPKRKLQQIYKELKQKINSSPTNKLKHKHKQERER